MNRDQVNQVVADAVASAWSPPFRGRIWEYARKLNLQKGYAVKGTFEIETANHIRVPLDEIHNPNKRLISIRKAVQTVGSLIADIVVPYWIEHDPGDTLWLFEDDPKAKLYAETRAMPLIQSIPEIARMLEGVDRHDKTKTQIKFKHMNLVLAGLNEGNVQSISYRYVIIDESWMAKANGLIRQAKDRTKQYPDSHKIILIGQGGLEDEDADIEHKQTDQRELLYACPFCGFKQIFELTRERDFTGPPPPGYKMLRPEVKYAGLSWDTNETTRPNGRWNYDEVGKTAHHVCYVCAGRIEDTPTMRRKLNDSYTYRVTNPGAPADSVGFWWPAEASMRVPFATLAVKYLRAKVAKEELSYTLPLQEFIQKDRGMPWSARLGMDQREITYEPYDVASEWPDEAFRVLIADCQKDLQRFFYHAYALSLTGEARMLDRGETDSFKGIAAAQTQWKIRDQLVFLDCGYEMTKVLGECVQHGHIAQIRIGGKLRKVWRCWTGLKGSGREVFDHIHPKTKVKEGKIYSERKYYTVSIGKKGAQFKAPWHEWSNLHAKDLLRARRDQDPHTPKFLVLPDPRPKTDIWSYHAQMRSEFREEKYEGGRKRSLWKLIKESLPNHDWDISSMFMAVQAILGVIGSPEPAAAPADGQ